MFITLSVALFAVVVRPSSGVWDAPLTEDGYYMLSVSRNIALGNGVTIDGNQWTNGFQPLFAFMMAPIYTLFDGARYSSLRGILALHWFLHVATALILGVIVSSENLIGVKSKRVLFWLTTLLWLASFQALAHSYNGLETGLVLLLYASAWRLYQLDWLRGWRLVAFSLLLGLLVLARIDTVVFVAFFLAAELRRSDVQGRERLLRVTVVGLSVTLVSLPWWLFNLVGFGSLMPSSGTAQSAPLAISRAPSALLAAAMNLVPYIPAVEPIGGLKGPTALIGIGLVQAGIALVIGVLFCRSVLPQVSHTSAVRYARTLLLSTTALLIYYLLFSGAEHFYGRYLTPYMLIAVPVTAVLLAIGASRNARTWMLVVPVWVYALLVAAAFSRGASMPYYTQQLQLIADHVPSSERVAAGQSGTIGYFRDDVVNLDGKVNPAALAYREHMWDYLREREIRWFCDWKWYAQWMLGDDPTANGWRLVASSGEFNLYHWDEGFSR